MIREIDKNDIPVCVQVIRESFLTVADEFHFTKENAPRFTAFSASKECLLWQFNAGRPMFAYLDCDKIIGYFSLEKKENGACELNNLCVLPAYRHDGIGGKLLTYAFDRAREMQCSKMCIGIVEENQVLRRWYESYGFMHTHTQKFDFFPFTCGYMEKTL